MKAIPVPKSNNERKNKSQEKWSQEADNSVSQQCCKKVLLDKKRKKVYVDIGEEEKVLMTKKPVRKVLECVCAGCEKAFSNQQGLSSHKLQ